MMEKENINIEETVNVKFVKTFRKLSIVSVIYAIVFCALYLFGSVIYKNKSIGIIEAINGVLQIFNIKQGMFYNYLFECIIGLVYIYFLFLIIRSVIIVIKSFIELKGTEDEKLICKIEIIFKNCKVLFIKYLIICFVSGMMSNVYVNWLMVICIVMSVLIFILNEIMIYLLTKNEDKRFIDVIVDLFEFIVLPVFIVVLGMQVIVPCAKDLSLNVNKLFQILQISGIEGKQIIYCLYVYCAKDLLYVIAGCMYFSFVNGIIDSSQKIRYYSMIKRKLVVMLIYFSIFMICDCYIQRNFFESEINFNFEVLKRWIEISKETFIPILLTILSYIIIVYNNKKYIK